VNPNSPTTPRMMKARERETLAIPMRTAGYTFASIAHQLRVSRPAAYKMVMRAIGQRGRDSALAADHLVTLEADRLDIAQKGVWKRVIDGDLLAIDRFLRISARRCALLGLDAPEKINLGGDLDVFNHDFEQEILRDPEKRRLADELCVGPVKPCCDGDAPN
jgi:hypothetical protein